MTWSTLIFQGTRNIDFTLWTVLHVSETWTGSIHNSRATVYQSKHSVYCLWPSEREDLTVPHLGRSRANAYFEGTAEQSLSGLVEACTCDWLLDGTEHLIGRSPVLKEGAHNSASFKQQPGQTESTSWLSADGLLDKLKLRKTGSANRKKGGK